MTLLVTLKSQCDSTVTLFGDLSECNAYNDFKIAPLNDGHVDSQGDFIVISLDDTSQSNSHRDVLLESS